MRLTVFKNASRDTLLALHYMKIFIGTVDYTRTPADLTGVFYASYNIGVNNSQKLFERVSKGNSFFHETI